MIEEKRMRKVAITKSRKFKRLLKVTLGERITDEEANFLTTKLEEFTGSLSEEKKHLRKSLNKRWSMNLSIISKAISVAIDDHGPITKKLSSKTTPTILQRYKQQQN